MRWLWTKKPKKTTNNEYEILEFTRFEDAQEAAREMGKAGKMCKIDLNPGGSFNLTWWIISDEYKEVWRKEQETQADRGKCKRCIFSINCKCHRYPPVLVSPAVHKVGETGPYEISATWSLPTIKPEHSCGEWKPKPPGPREPKEPELDTFKYSDFGAKP